MGKILYLHVGLPKTGSSAIQLFLGQNRAVLEEEGCCVPGSKISENLHHNIAFQASTQFDIETARQRFRNAIEDIAALGDRIVLSSEVFGEKYHTHQEVLSELRSYFKTIRVIIYLRRGDGMIESAYNHRIKRTPTSTPFSEGIWYNLDYTQNLSPFVEMFGIDNIIVRPFERVQFEGGMITTDFLSCIDVSENSRFVMPDGFTNTSLTLDALEYKRLVNTICTTEEARVSFADPLIQYSEHDKRLNPEDNSLTNLMSPLERVSLIKKIEPGYALIAQKYLGRKDGRLFYNPLPDPNEPWHPYPGLSKGKASEITQFLHYKSPELVEILYQRLTDQKLENENLDKARETLIPVLKEVLSIKA